MFCAGWSRLVKKAKIAWGRLMGVRRVQYRLGQAVEVKVKVRFM